MFQELSQGASSNGMVLPVTDIFSNGVIATGYAANTQSGQRNPTSATYTSASISNGKILTSIQKNSGHSFYGLTFSNSSATFNKCATLVFHVSSFSSNDTSNGKGVLYVGSVYQGNTSGISNNDDSIYVSNTGYYFVQLRSYFNNSNPNKYCGVGVYATNYSASVNVAMEVDYIGLLQTISIW